MGLKIQRKAKPSANSPESSALMSARYAYRLAVDEVSSPHLTVEVLEFADRNYELDDEAVKNLFTHIWKQVRGIMKSFSLLASCAVIVFLSCSAGAIGDVVAFGDSLSTPNFTDGPVYHQYVSDFLEMENNNYSVGGARTGPPSSNNMFNQVNSYLNLMPFVPSEDDLFALWGGAGDFLLSGSTDANAVVANLSSLVDTLVDRGARQILLVNQPLLGETPRGMPLRDQLNDVVTEFNALLPVEVERLKREHDIKIGIVDAYQLHADILADPGTFGFTDTNLISGSLFADNVHFRTTFHRHLADRTLPFLSQKFNRTTPLESVALSGFGGTYFQDFDAGLGADGSAVGVALPTAWTWDGLIFGNVTTESFPVGAAFGRRSVFNAGGPNDADRVLAVGVSSNRDNHFLQLLTKVTDSDANAFQLQFDVEAWDFRDGVILPPPINLVVGLPDDPGEAAFDVTVEIDTGDGFAPLVDFGAVTTGSIPAVTDGILDGNAEENRFSFDSGLLEAAIPVGSDLRIRWASATDLNTNGWVFGLDNVSLSLFGDDSTAGDFNRDGVLDVADLDALTAEILADPPGDPQFDLDGNGAVNNADISQWLSDAATENGFNAPYLPGDSDLDGMVNSADLNNLALNWQQDVALWSGGDFTADGSVNSADLNELALNWQQSIPLAAAQSVPEPSGILLLLVAGSVAAVSRFKNSSD